MNNSTVVIPRYHYVELFVTTDVQEWFHTELGKERQPAIDNIDGKLGSTNISTTHVRLLFKSEADAVLFKMRWL